jgi:tetratricopeptide (TPR) repeat protein
MLGFTISLLLLQAASGLRVPDLQPPTREVIPNTPAASALLRAGDASYAQGKLDEAIAQYENALKESPESVAAMSQLADSYFQKKEYQKALDIASKGVEYKADTWLPLLYTTMGNTLDVVGQGQKAAEMYNKGLALSPNAGILHYNLAMTQLGTLKDPAQARATLKRGAMADPNYPGIHFQLALSFAGDDLKTPALLAMSRYLVLDGAAPRAGARYGLWRQLLNGNARPNPNGQIQILVNPNQKKDEGNLQILDTDISMSKALSLKTSTGKAEMQILFEQIESLFTIYAKREPGDDKDKFLWTYYMPYITEMQQKKFVEPFVYYASQRSGIPGVQDWMNTNSAWVAAFLDWSKRYSWPKP